MLREQWYALCETRELSRRPLALERLGRRLVAWRDADGEPVVMEDRCPHRGAKLSDGWVADGQLVCPYHGFRYDRTGRCTHTPVHPDRKPSRALCSRAWTVREAHGLLWAWYGEPREDLPPIPWFDRAPDGGRSTASSGMVFPVHHTRVMESMFDAFHIAFAHRRSVPGAPARLEDYEVEVDGQTIVTRGRLCHTPDRPGRPFELHATLPGVLYLELDPRVVAAIAVTPIDEQRTWVWGRYHQRIVDVPILGSWLAWAVLNYDWVFIQKLEDIPILKTLDPPVVEPGRSHWVAADEGSARWVQLYHTLLAEQESRERAAK